MVLGCFPEKLKSLQNFRRYLCRPLSGFCEINFSLSISIKYIDPYCMQSHLLFGIPFCFHDNINKIKILSTIYLLIAVTFLSVAPYWHHESCVHKNRKFFHDTGKTGSTSNICFSMTIGTLRMIFNCINFMNLL